LEAGPDTRVIIETPDMNHPAHRLPAVMFYQSGQNHLQRDIVKRVIGFFVSHIAADKLSLVSLPGYYNLLYLGTYSSKLYATSFIFNGME
jgi:hypothetical protein